MRGLKLVNALLLGSALIGPAALMAQQETTTTTTTQTQRYYDPVYRTYHNWDSNEDRAYRMYLDQTHRTYTEYPKETVTVQRDYWKWRHSHPNKMIFKSETEETH